MTHAFGLSGYGRFTVVVAFVELIGGFFNLRVGITTTTFGARWLADDPRVAAGVFQYGFLIDMGTTLVSIVLLGLIALVAGHHIVGSGSELLIPLYALALIGPTLNRSAFVVLRLLDRFRLIATYAWAFELARIALIVAAIQLFDGLTAVVLAIVIATLSAGIVNAAVSVRVFRRARQLSLTRSHLVTLHRPERRAMLRTLSHTGVISYGRVVQTQLPTVLLNAIAGPTQTGIYKIGMAAAAIVGKLVDPVSSALLPRLSRLWAAGRFAELRRLVFRASLLCGLALGVVFTTVVVFQDPILRFLGGGQEGEAASTVLLLGASTQVLYGLVFWHSTLLYAANRTGPMSLISVTAVVVQIAAMLVLVPELESTGAALALVCSQVIINVGWTTLALRTLRSVRTHPTDRTTPEPVSS